MGISVFGLGYVGCVSVACFCKAGRHVIGVDVDEEKVDCINRGHAPVHEAGLKELIQQHHSEGSLRATQNVGLAIRDTEISFITVGTPSRKDGSTDLTAVHKVVDQIAEQLRLKDGYHLVVLRSTVPPGTSEACIDRLEARSGKEFGEDFGWCMNPEFLREGSAIQDFYDPPYTIIGEADSRSGTVLEKLYGSMEGLGGEIYRIGLGEAEMIKFTNNCFHSMKVSFGNEIGRLCKKLGLDGATVMELVAADHKLNLSPYYLRPGPAFGGSCLPKDTRAMVSLGARVGAEIPLLKSIIGSNDEHIRHAVTLIQKLGKTKIGFVGLTFKSGTDDLRESPVLAVLSALAKAGGEVRAFDRAIGLGEHLLGENRRILQRLLSKVGPVLSTSLAEVIEASEVIVFSNGDREYTDELVMLVREDQVLFDLTGAFPAREALADRYESVI